ncbi:ATPase, T2SS/T4P/T4SS family [Plantibacter sp. M259]|uniref:ATPase, T2SS/T4P/T4SS family n=1 Tax=Plantibacter sp. M259 TaxID=2583822 RepID=UPI003512958A
MRPDRLVLGECRGPEVRELLSALNTGHDGGAGTLHANSVTDVPARLEALGALAGMSQEAVARQSTSAIGLVVHLARLPVGRQVVAVGRLLIDEHDRLSVEELP